MDKWTVEEINIIKQYYKNKKTLTSLLPSRSWKAVQNQIWLSGNSKKIKTKTINVKKWKYEEDLLVINLFDKDNVTLKSKLSNRSWKAICNRAWTLRVMKPKNFWNKNDDDILFKHYYDDKFEDLMKLLPGREKKSIMCRASMFQLKRKSSEKVSNMEILLKDCPESYYWIGFLLADGHFSHKDHSISLNSGIKDYEHILNYGKYISYHGNCKRGNAIVSGNSKVFPQIISKFGNISNRKTYIPPQLDILPRNDLFFSLIIGFIDGDGCIYDFGTKNKSNPIRITIGVFESWFNNLKLFYNFIFDYFNYSWIKEKLPGGYPKILHRTSESCINGRKINSSGDAARCYIHYLPLIKDIKNKIIDLKLPVLDRKWNKIHC